MAEVANSPKTENQDKPEKPNKWNHPSSWPLLSVVAFLILTIVYLVLHACVPGAKEAKLSKEEIAEATTILMRDTSDHLSDTVRRDCAVRYILSRLK